MAAVVSALCPALCLPACLLAAGHESMLAAWEEVVEPAARRFRPDIILVSAGYDAHWADPLAGGTLANCSCLELAFATHAQRRAALCLLSKQACRAAWQAQRAGGCHLSLGPLLFGGGSRSGSSGGACAYQSHITASKRGVPPARPARRPAALLGHVPRAGRARQGAGRGTVWRAAGLSVGRGVRPGRAGAQRGQHLPR